MVGLFVLFFWFGWFRVFGLVVLFVGLLVCFDGLVWFGLVVWIIRWFL